LIPLPCWKDLPPEAYRTRIAGLVEKIEADAAALREQTGRPPLGAEAILRQDPKTEPILAAPIQVRHGALSRFHFRRHYLR